MSINVQTANALRTVRTWARERNEARGYVLSYKRVGLAFAIELLVICTSLYGAWLFAQMYGRDDEAKRMMMLAPLGYALIEFCRVPLALSTRTHRSLFIRALAVLGVVAAMGVTVKSVSQLGEMMFRPRLLEVNEKHRELIDLRNEQASLVKRIGEADTLVEQLAVKLKDAEQGLSEATTELGKLPRSSCRTDWIKGRRTIRCQSDPRMAVMKKNLETATAARDAAQKRLDHARAERAELKQEGVDRRVSEAQIAHKTAVFNSQLHSFTAMAFAKDPAQVTDGEIAWFLRLFVFVPAFMVAIAATLLAITSVERIKPKQLELSNVELDEGAGAYILQPFAHEIIREATEAAERIAANAIGKAARPELKVVGEA